MILPSPELILSVGAALLALWCAVTVAACRARWAQGTRESASNLEKLRVEIREEMEKTLRQLSATTPVEPVTAEAPCDSGRLNRSARARALKLLRTGVPPDAAAATLEMPRKDVVLLARVGSILAH